MSEALAQFRKPVAIGEAYTPAHREEIISEFCSRLTEGEALTAIIESPSMPGMGTVFRWLNADPAAWEKYTRARETQAHLYAARAMDEALSAKDAQIGRLRMDALKWAAGKLAPKFYGDSTQLRHADADGEKINNSGLVSELLNLMGANTQAPIEGKAKLKNVTPEPAKSVYRPRIARPADDVEDLV